MRRMGIGLGVGINRSNYAQGIFNAYSARVVADGGVVESGSCVDAVSYLLQSASLLLIPSGYKGGKLYAEIPTNGNGDLTWARTSTANRTNASGNIELMATGVPRLSYMYGSCPSALLEPQRTNSIRNSSMVGAVAGSPGTLPTNWSSFLGILTRSIAGVGIENGLPYVDIRLNGTATATTFRVDFEVTSLIAASNGQAWTNSIYAKIISAPNPALSYSLQMIERSSASGFVADGTQFFTPTTLLQRFAFTRTLSGGATTAFVQPALLFNLTNGATYDFTIRIAAPQMELGAYATTWVPTTSATATRVADSFSRSNIYTNGLISASGGTWFVELRGNVAYVRDATGGIYLSDTPLGNGWVLRNNQTTAVRLTISKVVSGVLTGLFTPTTDTVKIAIKWNGTTADIFVNGVKEISATSFTITAMEYFSTSVQQPTFIQQMALFPTPLSDTDCTTITTL